MDEQVLFTKIAFSVGWAPGGVSGL